MIPKDPAFSPLEARSLKDAFIERFESLILSGAFKPGERVPPERELGQMFGVSRPVVHEGLRTLETRGLVTIESRKGVRVNDFRSEGSIEMLLSILNYSGGVLSAELLDGILEMRIVIEAETARLAAKRRSADSLARLEGILAREKEMLGASAREIADIDYAFHHAVAIASGNQVYPLLMNSFRRIYRNILEFFYMDRSVVAKVFEFHAALVESIRAQDEARAARGMLDILEYGESSFRRMKTS